MKITCGIFLYSLPQNGFLICHATRSRFNLWSIPKGIKEEPETCYESATRELFEETGVEIEKLNIILKKELPPVKYKKQAKTLQSFLIVTDTDLKDFHFKCSSLVDGKYPEVDRFGWATFEQMKQLVHESQVVNLAMIREIIPAL